MTTNRTLFATISTRRNIPWIEVWRNPDNTTHLIRNGAVKRHDPQEWDTDCTPEHFIWVNTTVQLVGVGA